MTSQLPDTGCPFCNAFQIAYPPPAWDYPAGTVWQCDCGQAWVSTGPPNDHTPGMVNFRREGRLEQRRRLRKNGDAS